MPLVPREVITKKCPSSVLTVTPLFPEMEPHKKHKVKHNEEDRRNETKRKAQERRKKKEMKASKK